MWGSSLHAVSVYIHIHIYTYTQFQFFMFYLAKHADSVERTQLVKKRKKLSFVFPF
jgi:hypothetical protein